MVIEPNRWANSARNVFASTSSFKSRLDDAKIRGQRTTSIAESRQDSVRSIDSFNRSINDDALAQWMAEIHGGQLAISREERFGESDSELYDLTTISMNLELAISEIVRGKRSISRR